MRIPQCQYVASHWRGKRGDKLCATDRWSFLRCKSGVPSIESRRQLSDIPWQTLASLSGRGRGCVGVHKFGLDLVSMLSSPGSQLQHLAGSCMTKAAAAPGSAPVSLMTQRAAANQHASIPGVYSRQATPLSRPACAIRVALQRVSQKSFKFSEATCQNLHFCSTLPALGSAAARIYCQITGLAWARRRLSAWHGRLCAGSCNAAVRFGSLSSWVCFWQVLAKRQRKAMQLSTDYVSQQNFRSSGCA